MSEPGERERGALAEAYFDMRSLVGTFEKAEFEGVLTIEFVTPTVSYEEALSAGVAFLRLDTMSDWLLQHPES
ncbi:hypothetical protein [Halocatena marina]|uniref:Uncharacterized protein n=1 Tax=Halocatena marina TaxID=2934937 RepID=A0ABD5YY16_9EURY|nr:hypothetical protein [Halocatena marina]